MDGLVNDYLSEEAKKKLEVGLPPEEFLAIVREDLEQQGIFDDATNWMLVRKRDGLTKYSKDIKWVDGDKRELTDEIQVGRWLAMSPFNEFFTWKTSPITEIIEAREDHYHFKTWNSEYKLFFGTVDVLKSDEYNDSIGEWIGGL